MEKRKNKLLRLVIRLTVFAAILAFAFLAFAGYFIYSVKNGKYGQLPDYHELKNIRNHVASEVYSADSVLLGKYYLVNRTNASWSEISPNIINALIATEDVRFFEHKGIDKRSLARVLVKSLLLKNESSGGGSTISQQLVKNLYGRKTYQRFGMAINKIKEAIIAHRLENIYSKEEILTLYLNTVSFGENVFGIEAATERYFSTTPKDVTLNEAAVLIGMLKATTSYNPRANPEKAKSRRNIVIGQMVKYDLLNKSVADSVKVSELSLKYKYITHNDGLAPYFRETVRLEIQKLLNQHPKPDGTTYNLYTDGLRIYTTINSKMQKYAEDAVSGHIKTLQAQFFKHWKNKNTNGKTDAAVVQAKLRSPRYKELKAQNVSEQQIDKIFVTPVKMKLFTWDGEQEQEMSPLDSIRYYQHYLSAGFLAMEPSTGKILAWVGGVDYKHFKYDHIRSKRQVGSTFKPIVYAAAIEKGLEPCNYISNERETYEQLENWSPANADGNYEGFYSMQGALMKSLNTVTTKLMLETGTEPVINLAKRMGISSNLPEVPSLGLGTASISLEEMISAYSTFPNRGYRATPYHLEKITDADGKVIIDFSEKAPPKVKAMEEKTADIINYFLKTVVESGTAADLRAKYGLRNEIGGKTGTTQKQADGWFIGYTPDVVAGVWVGHDDPKVHFNTPGMGQGSKTALPIWANFMKQVYATPEFEEQKKARFTPLSPELREILDCATFTMAPKITPQNIVEMLFGPSKKEKRERKPKVKKEKSETKTRFIDKLKKLF
jgi:penicillin-binding protein 1A